MATSPLPQVASSSVDLAGLSICTAAPTAARLGTVYDPATFAAAVPIHFHPLDTASLGGTNFLMLCSQRWTGAIPDASQPGYYSSHTADTTSGWVRVNAATGARSMINAGYAIPMKTAATAATVTAAVSRGPGLLWILYEATVAGEPAAIVQSWHYNVPVGTMTALSEEVIPNAASTETVVFAAGMQLSTAAGPYIYVYGTGSTTGHVYAVRKSWSRVGHTGTPTRPLDTAWEYGTATGWSTDPTQVAPVQTTAGPMQSAGPVSLAHYAMKRRQNGWDVALRGHNLISTVAMSGTTATAQIYSSLAGRLWQPVGSPVPLGVSGSTYTGAGLLFQGSLGANPAIVQTPASVSAIPQIVSMFNTSSGSSQIQVSWSSTQIPRIS